MSDIAVLDAPSITKRINKTNLAYATHHYGQALQSLSRAQDMMEELSSNTGNAGDLAARVFDFGQTSKLALLDANGAIDDINRELKAFFG